MYVHSCWIQYIDITVNKLWRRQLIGFDVNYTYLIKKRSRRWNIKTIASNVFVFARTLQNIFDDFLNIFDFQSQNQHSRYLEKKRKEKIFFFLVDYLNRQSVIKSNSNPLKHNFEENRTQKKMCKTTEIYKKVWGKWWRV